MKLAKEDREDLRRRTKAGHNIIAALDKYVLSQLLDAIDQMECCGNCLWFQEDTLTENCAKNGGDYRACDHCEKWEFGR